MSHGTEFLKFTLAFMQPLLAILFFVVVWVIEDFDEIMRKFAFICFFTIIFIWTHYFTIREFLDISSFFLTMVVIKTSFFGMFLLLFTRHSLEIDQIKMKKAPNLLFLHNNNMKILIFNIFLVFSFKKLDEEMI